MSTATACYDERPHDHDIPDHLPALHDALIPWFAQHKADLPWRRSKDPYAIWLSEIMLQQTQVTTVIPYYERFLARFPTVRGSGRRAAGRRAQAVGRAGLLSAARAICTAPRRRWRSEFGGEFPATVDALLALPGIGRYTAGAIASLAFGIDAPVLDGNVIRILARLFNHR